MLVKLIWQWSGYQPEFCNWKDFYPYCNGDMIAHDLFHHQPNELGGFNDELRAIGARVALNPITIYQARIGEDIEDWCEKSPNKFEGIVLIAYHFSPSGESFEYYLAVLKEGYKYGKTINREAYEYIKSYDFVSHHNLREDLLVDKETGEVKSLKG